MHDEDIQMLAGHNLPGFDKLSQSLTTITKQRTSEHAGLTFQTTHFAAGVVMRRVRLHIEYLLGVCSDLDTSENSNNNINVLEKETRHERELLCVFMRSQMYQRHQDDNQEVGVVTQCGEGNLLSSSVVASHLPLDTKQRSERSRDWKTAADALFRIAMTGVNVVQDEDRLFDSNNPADSDTKAVAEMSAVDRNKGYHGDWIELLSAEVTLPGRTNSNQSRKCTLLLLHNSHTGAHLTFAYLHLVKSTSSRRTNHDLDGLHPSPSGSPTIELERQPVFGNRVSDASLAVVQHSHRQPSRKGDFGFSRSYSPTSSLGNAQFNFLDLTSSPTDNARVRSNSDLATYDDLGITIDPRRMDTEAAVTGIGSFVDEEPTDSPESDSSWFSASSSVDGKETDSNDQDSPRYREQLLELSAATCEDGKFTRGAGRAAEIDSSTRASSSRTIQRVWRQWKVEHQSAAVEKDEHLNQLAVERLWVPLDVQHDQTLFSPGVLVHKVSWTRFINQWHPYLTVYVSLSFIAKQKWRAECVQALSGT